MNDNTKAIVISSLDLERIEELLEQPIHRDSPGTAALRAELARANVLDPAEMPADVITMNSVATFVDESSDESREISLVYPREADTATNKISVFAPVGSAMLGLRVGQSIDWKVPGGRNLRLRVTGISFQPEANGQFHR
ncbi:MAG: nucleoside diphosphate kinase regulator [Dokdonella sp.]